MNKKQWLIFGFLVAFVIGAVLFFIQQQKIASVQNQNLENSDEEMPKQGQDYPQYIEAISGNTDEVWYNIPELGVRMKLNKEFAEELIYSDGMVDDYGAHQDGIYFSTKAITEVAPECTPKRGGALGFIFKREGNAIEEAKTEEYLAARVDDYTQIGNYYYGWVGPQATCWFLPHQEMAEKEWSKEYAGNSGPKNLYNGSKTIELIP